MNWLVYHIVSGHAFFTGVILLIGAATASLQSRLWIARLALPGTIVGCLAIVVSSTPVPIWLAVVAVVVIATWCVPRIRKKHRRAVVTVVIAVAVVAACCEIPFHVSPTLKRSPTRTLTVIGDSVTAGTGADDQSEKWPDILKRQYVIEIQDISHMGDTVARALKRASEQRVDSSVIVIEIGGNDILGSTSPTQFSRDLDALLAELSGSDRQIVMFELPLPPFYHAYGRAQRRAAAKHNVVLIPKRVFLSVIADDSSTMDSIHLSQSGHQLMADRVWQVIGPAFVTPHD